MGTRRRPLAPRTLVIPLSAVTALAGCGGDYEFQPPDREAQVAAADSVFSTAMFDTMTWASDSARALDGNVVYSSRCRRCHGPLGRGETEYARQRELEVPSLVAPDWEYEGDLEAVRRRIFTGHPRGMPTWGVAGITPREIDAVAFYILDSLRPEVLGEG